MFTQFRLRCSMAAMMIHVSVVCLLPAFGCKQARGSGILLKHTDVGMKARRQADLKG